jgi:hypothetical protein
MENKNLNLLILGFLTLIVGIALISTVSTSVLDRTSKDVVVDEAYNLTGVGCYQVGQVNGTTDVNCNITVVYAPTGWETSDCPLTSVVVSNTGGTALTLNTDYRLFAYNGIVQMLNTSATNLTNMGNNVLIDYTNCPADYLDSDFGRSVTNLVPGFFALALLGISLLIFYTIAKNEGIIN